MQHEIRVLVVEDDEDDFAITSKLLESIRETKYRPVWVKNYDDGMKALVKSDHAVCLLDYQLGDRNGLEFLYEAAIKECEVPIILFTDQGDYDIDVEAAKLGASDYMIKGQISTPILERSMRYSIERKKIEQSRDTALDSTRLKSEFLANMSHEVRTPMTGIIGMLDMLMETPLDETQIEYAEIMRMSTNSLMSIIDDILDFSKIEAGKLKFEKIDFDLTSNIENITELFAERAYAKNIEIVSLIATDIPTALIGDPGRLRQVLTNLVGNAVKFTNEGEVSIFVTKTAENEKTVALKFAVTDTGIGISRDAQAILFQAFTQADGSTTRKFGGTGLGLSISRQLVEMMGGDIHVESVQDQGSTFAFSARFEKQTEIETRITPPVNLENLRVLIVDGNATIRMSISHQTDSWGMIAFEAENGEAALEMMEGAAVSANPFDLLILDLKMSGMDGFEVVQEVRKNPLIAETKVILIPAYGQRGDGRTADKAGIDGYLVKPIRQSDLYDCIASILSEEDQKVTADCKSSKEKRKLVTRHAIQENRVKQNIRILVAEDNIVNQKVTKSQIERLGYEVDIVENGVEALHALETKSYSMILMDCQMPKMDGYEATAEIRRSGTAKNVPIIAVTANAMSGERDMCLAAGMNDYLTKPFRQADLVRIIDRWSKTGSHSNGIEPARVDKVDDSLQVRFPGNDNLEDAEELLSF